ncbi:arginine metabolism regulation ii [Fusarium sporotrichioides]|uniref:Arginine metabolism regulation ii n=1 Tax=Fusarium sporotrichioides TaxID=5514 RepID=A0A395SAQ8_FUSSP|nr:arginine metabolism regulation ii [Fusarium sporotrichioides]
MSSSQRRDCEGYGLRLSWPRQNDKRRAIVGLHSKQARFKGIPLNHRLVNASSRDIELYHMISTPAHIVQKLADTPFKPVKDTVLAKQSPLLLLNPPATGAFAELSTANKSLFQYFVERASYSISTLGRDSHKIPGILTRMALSDKTPSSTAVLKSSLALASFHRDNALHATARSKVAALRALAESTQAFISVNDSACHIAAGIILCTLEIQQNSTTSSHWLWYACGATKIVKTAGLDEIKTDSDLTSLVGNRLQTLDYKLQNIVVHDTSSLDMHDDQTLFNMAVELYRLSTLIYLRRASAGILDLEKDFNDWVDQAFILLAHLPTCQWPFPLFIFGCEARDDGRRLILLDLIERTTKDGRYRSLAPIKRLIEIIWVQQDLLDDDLDYVRKLGVILSSTQKSVPAFL